MPAKRGTSTTAGKSEIARTQETVETAETRWDVKKNWAPATLGTSATAEMSAITERPATAGTNGTEMAARTSAIAGSKATTDNRIHNCTYVQLVGNSSRNEYSKTRSLVINPSSVTVKIWEQCWRKSANTTQGWKSAKLARHVSLDPALTQCGLYSRWE